LRVLGSFLLVLASGVLFWFNSLSGKQFPV
jgi:hypothetical protein